MEPYELEFELQKSGGILTHMLTDLIVQKAKPKAKMYNISDGDRKGLCLLVYPNGGKYWRYRYYFQGKAKMFSLGTYPDISLEEARKRLAEARTTTALGIDPSKQKQALKQESQNTFELVAREWHEKEKGEWSKTHARDVLRRLDSNLFPYLGSRPIKDIKPIDLLNALRKIEERGALDIAKRCRQTAGQIFRYAVITERAEHDISVNLKDALKTRKPEKFKSIKPHELPEFMKNLRQYDGELLTKLATHLLLLTFVRTGELRGARWEEIHWQAKEWRIPPERMKKKHGHIVPLAHQTLDIFTRLKKISGHTPFIFPNANNPKNVMSENTILYAIYRMGYHSRATGHGFRRTASTALNEMRFDRDIIEFQLAHAPKDQIRGIYNEAEYLPEREVMMQHWANFLDAMSEHGEKITTKDFRVNIIKSAA